MYGLVCRPTRGTSQDGAIVFWCLRASGLVDNLLDNVNSHEISKSST